MIDGTLFDNRVPFYIRYIAFDKKDITFVVKKGDILLSGIEYAVYRCREIMKCDLWPIFR